MCAWNFGTTATTSSGAKYNYTTSTGTNYLLQQEWVNTGGGLGFNGGHCGMSGSTAFAANGGSGFDVALSDSVVEAPEPSTWTLIGSALAGLAVLSRRRRRLDKVV
jgi:hypothetical protein